MFFEMIKKIKGITDISGHHIKCVLRHRNLDLLFEIRNWQFSISADMSIQHVQHGRGHGNSRTARSMWSSSLESGIFCLKYGIEKFLSQLIF